MVALLVTGVAQALGFLLQVVLAQLLGDIEFGYYSYAMAWLSVGLIVGKLGYDTALIRFVAAFHAKADWSGVREILMHARGVTFMASAVIAAAAACAVWWNDGSSPLAAVLFAAVLLLPIAVFSEITAAALRGLGRVGVALVGDGVVRPLVVLVALILSTRLAPGGTTAEYATYAYLAGTLCSIALTMGVLRWAFPMSSGTGYGTARDPAVGRAWIGAALPMMLANGFLVLLYSVDTLMLGWLADTTEAGYYSIASKVALLVLFAMNSAQSIAAPMLSAAHVSGRTGDFAQVIRYMNLFGAAVALPLAILAATMAPWLLGLLGPGFASAAVCLQLLALMQMINVLTGPVGTVLTMTGHQRSLVGLLAFGLCVNVLLNIAWIPDHGASGAALAALVSHSAWNLVGVAIVRSRIGVDCSIVSAWRRAAEAR